ncbi:ATP-dependent DNA ligase, partial [Phenylobacterium sp. LjRoot97]
GPAGEKWSHEIKFDGYRVQLHVHGGTPTIFTRNSHDWTAKFPELAAHLGELPDCILDGELCALDGQGRPSFTKQRTSISPGRTKSLLVFLRHHLGPGRGHTVLSAQHPTICARGGAGRLGKHAAARGQQPAHGRARDPGVGVQVGLEGSVSKRLDAPYGAGRSDTWVKAKCGPSQEVVIGGWKQEPGRAFKGLLVGVYDFSRLTYAGSIKTGFSPDMGMLKRLRAPSDGSLALCGRHPAERPLGRPEWADGGKLRGPLLAARRPICYVWRHSAVWGADI